MIFFHYHKTNMINKRMRRKQDLKALLSLNLMQTRRHKFYGKQGLHPSANLHLCRKRN